MLKYLRIFFVVLIAMLTMTTITYANTFVVDDDGDPGSTYATLNAAILTAESFPGVEHEIVIMAGTYSDAGLVISDPTKIASIIGDPLDDRANIVFQAGNYQVDNFLDISGTTGMTVSGFTVMDYSTAFHGTGVADVVITDMVLANNGVDGYVSAADEVGGAIILYDCDDGLFDNLHILDGERGLGLRGSPDYSDGNTISNCLIENNEQYGIGIGWYGGSNNTITNNTVSGSEDFGLQIRGAGTGNVISDNTVFDCLWEGITVSGPTGTVVSGNTVYGCASNPINPSGANDHGGISYAGIDIEGAATSATIFGNNSYDNGDGVNGLGINVDGWWCEIYDNCFYGHPGAQAVDNELGASANFWHDNYYSDIAVGATSYLVGGGTYSTTDLAPKMRSNSPVAASSTMEVWSSQVVDFTWALPDVCDPADVIDFAAYEFTVSWDPNLLSFQAGDNNEFFGAAGLYVFTSDDAATGSITFSGVDIANPNIEAGILGWAEFQAIGVGPATISIASVYRDVNNVAIPVQSNSIVLTLEDTEVPSITVTANDLITGTDTYSDGSIVGGNVQLFIEGTVSDNFDVSSVWYNIDDQASVSWTLISPVSGTADTYGGLPGSFYIDLSPVVAEGPHTLNVIVLDASGNRDSVYYNFIIDRTGPDVASLALTDADGCADVGFTNDDVVAVSWDNPDGSAVEHEFYSLDAPGWQGALALANPTTYAFDGTEGSHSLWVRQYDVFGNLGAQMGPVAITVDKTAPAPSDPYLVTSPSQSTTVTNLSSIAGDFNMEVGTGTVEFMFSEDMGAIICGAAEWASAPPAGSAPRLTIPLSAGDGMKVIYFGSRDAAGNIGIVADSITLDQTAPELSSFVVEDITGSDCSDTWNVHVIVGYDSDAAEIALSGVSGSYGPTWGLDGTSPDTIVFNINSFGVPVCDDINTIFGSLIDDAANMGGELSDEIIVDCGVPLITSVLATDTDYDGVSLAPHVDWSNSATVNLEISGLAADVNEIQVSETGVFGGEETSFAVTPPADDPLNISYTHSSPTGCTADDLYVRALDCAGKISATVSDGIVFDLDAPVISSFTVTSPDPTNVLSVDVAIAATDVCNLWRMQVYEDGYEGDGTGWVLDAVSATIALQDVGDGTRTIHLEMIDPTGNMSATTVTVEVDQTLPTGDFTVQQFGNPYTTAGYTSSLSDIEIVGITWDADAVDMAVRNSDGSNNSGWIPVAATYTPHTLVAGGNGTRTVQMIFRDATGNYDPWTSPTQHDIEYLGTAPAAPATATGTPGGSVALEWDAVTAAQMYLVKFNNSGEYPTYDPLLTPAPHPADTVEGLFAYLGSDLTYDFAGPTADIYSFSIWTIDLAGNLSTSPNTDVVATNYILGDMNLDGDMTFVDDFGKFSTSYLLSTGDMGFLADADFGPTSDNSGTGLPMPDGIIDLEDLIIMGMNYDTYNTSANRYQFDEGFDKLASQGLEIIADIGDYQHQGEFTVVIRTSSSNVIKAYNLILGYDADDAELISVEAGEIHENAPVDFFYVKTDESSINITGMIMGSEFEGEEMVKLTFKTKSGDFRIESKDLIVRDNQNNDLDATFSRVGKIIPDHFVLEQNYPNPFNPTTTIQFSLPVDSDFSLTIFNITGQKVHVFDGHSPAGKVTVEWNANRNSSGIYFYKLEAGTFSSTKKMVLLK